MAGIVAISVQFYKAQPWAVLPSKVQVDRGAARERAETYLKHFRFIRAERRPENCPPWVMGTEIGWRVRSPVDVDFTELRQVEIDASSDPAEAAKAVNRPELWGRERSHLAVGKNSWLHLYQFQTERGWENMFTPNGAGTVEWRLGWGAVLPRGYFFLILPSDPAGPLGVPAGVMTSTVVNRLSSQGGMSLAVHPPPTPVSVTRGQEIARIIPLHADSLQAVAHYGAPPAGGEDEEPG